ncbi:MAG TPA: SH3 domain-containing protein [Gemmatimonadales bacterium]
MMAQSSLPRWAQPAWHVALCLLAAVPAVAAAQTRYQVARGERFRIEPGESARALGTVAEGAEVVGAAERDGFTEITLQGWIWGRSVAGTDRDGFDLAVNARSGENLRAAPNGRIIGRLASGFLLNEVSRNNEGWVQVRRTGWIASPALRAVGAPAGAASGSSSPDAEPPPTDGGGPKLDRGVTVGDVELHRVPEGPPTGRLGVDSPVRVLARSGEWVRVATEGWIRERDLRPSEAGVLLGVSAAEVTARPRDFEGKLVQWTVQFISLQTADELRPEMPPGARYALARGPLPEAGFVYVVLQPAQVRFAEALQPLAEIVMIARVRAGRSRYLATPVVDAVDLSERRP